MIVPGLLYVPKEPSINHVIFVLVIPLGDSHHVFETSPPLFFLVHTKNLLFLSIFIIFKYRIILFYSENYRYNGMTRFSVKKRKNKYS